MSVSTPYGNIHSWHYIPVTFNGVWLHCRKPLSGYRNFVSIHSSFIPLKRLRSGCTEHSGSIETEGKMFLTHCTIILAITQCTITDYDYHKSKIAISQHTCSTKEPHFHCDGKQTDGVTALRKTYHVQACSTVRKSITQKKLRDMSMTQRHRWAAK